MADDKNEHPQIARRAVIGAVPDKNLVILTVDTGEVIRLTSDLAMMLGRDLTRLGQMVAERPIPAPPEWLQKPNGG